MAYKDFINDFRKGLTGDVLFFYGAEDYLMDWALSQITDKYISDEWRSLDLRTLEGDSVSAYDIMGEARAYSMFSDKRVIIVRNYLPLYKKNADPGANDLLAFAKERQDTAIVVFVLESRYAGDITSYGRKFIKVASSYDFSRLDKADLRAFITKRVRAAGKMIPRRELDYLIDLSGYYLRDSNYSLTSLDRDLTKILTASGDEAITASLIESLLTGQNDKFVFDLVDALVSGNRSKSLEIAETIIREDDASMQVIALLTKQFEIMYDAIELSADGYSIPQMAKKTGINEFRFKKAYLASGNYRRGRIKELLISLYNIDRDIKRGNIDKDIALELFAATACP